MTLTYYDIGDRRKLSVEIRDEAGDLADPTTLVFSILEPDGTLTSYTSGTDIELANDSTGIYHVYWDCTLPGVHHWRYEADGAVVAAEEAVFRVRRSRVLDETPGS